jgi:hypothetical protein
MNNIISSLTKNKLGLVAFAVVVLIVTITIVGCKKSTSSSIDTDAQEGFKKLEQIEHLMKQMDAEKKRYASRTNEVITLQDIVYPLSKVGVTNFLHLNNNHPAYQLVDQSQLSTYLTGLRKFYFDNKVLDWYSKGVFDCGDYAMGATWYAKSWHRNLKDKVDGTSIAIGTVFYKQDESGQYHAINAAILKDRSVVFFEPQVQNTVNLSKSEIQSIYYVQF